MSEILVVAAGPGLLQVLNSAIYRQPSNLRSITVIAEWGAYATAAACTVLAGAAIADLIPGSDRANPKRRGQVLLAAASTGIAVAVGFALLASAI